MAWALGSESGHRLCVRLGYGLRLALNWMGYGLRLGMSLGRIWPGLGQGFWPGSPGWARAGLGLAISAGHGPET